MTKELQSRYFPEPHIPNVMLGQQQKGLFQVEYHYPLWKILSDYPRYWGLLVLSLSSVENPMNQPTTAHFCLVVSLKESPQTRSQSGLGIL